MYADGVCVVRREETAAPWRTLHAGIVKIQRVTGFVFRKDTGNSVGVETMDLVPPSSSRPRFYRPELDAMRLFAFLCIFGHHTLTPHVMSGRTQSIGLRSILATSLKFAVSLFFVLSGYLITTLLAMEKENTGRVHLRAFYQRRIARIWPLYYAFTLVVLVIGAFVPRLLPTARALAAFTFFSGNWYLVFAHSIVAGGLGILWSINIEEQFYLLWPLMIKGYERRAVPGFSLGVVAAAYLVLFWLGRHGIVSDVSVRFNTLVEMQFFAAGSLLAVWLPREGLHFPGWARLLLAGCGLLCWGVGTRLFDDMTPTVLWWMPAALYGCVMAGCVVLFVSFFGIPGRWIPRPVLWLGKISYGLYVYHVLVLSLMAPWSAPREHKVSFAVAHRSMELLLTILVAGLSYRWLERPFLRWKERATFVPNRQV
jgi:peptidoglycan/LPS O-acetylase OafA/YrhL